MAHLDNPVYLERLPLLGDLPVQVQPSDMSRGQALCRTLRLAIEALAPRGSEPAGALDALTHEVLYRYAIARQSMISITRQLNLSERQGYRLLRHAIEAVASYLAARISEGTTTLNDADPDPSAPSVRNELERLLAAGREDVELGGLLEQLMTSLEELAAEKRVSLRLERGSGPVHASVNRVLLRQALLSLLSHVIASTEAEESITVALQRAASSILVQISHRSQSGGAAADPRGPYAVACQALGLLGAAWEETTDARSLVHYTIELPAVMGSKILIVDDNEDLVALFTRYLSRQPYAIRGVTGVEALEVLDKERPDIIILDIMMPHRDGWEILQAIRASSRPHCPKIIVCTIINDPKLAEALGADLFLNKPVTREQLLQALYALRASPT
ncbi:MAG: response regulator [Anaerolineae bacterium]|nr:response regulator [Anaerolineae bacterium]